ncbi:MAG: PUA domain-containing protein [Thermoplasmatota archaeon]
MAIRNRHPVRQKKAADILQHIKETLGCDVTVDRVIETADIDGREMLIIDGNIDVFYLDGEPMLTLPGIHHHEPSQRYVTVDHGAVKFVLNGADVMAPGITDADPDIEQEDLVWIRNPEGTGIAVGRALVDGPVMVEQTNGKAVETLHYIGDELWEHNETLKA